MKLQRDLGFTEGQVFNFSLLAPAAGLVPAAANQETLYAALFSCQSSVLDVLLLFNEAKVALIQLKSAASLHNKGHLSPWCTWFIFIILPPFVLLRISFYSVRAAKAVKQDKGAAGAWVGHQQWSTGSCIHYWMTENRPILPNLGTTSSFLHASYLKWMQYLEGNKPNPDRSVMLKYEVFCKMVILVGKTTR